MDHFYTFFHQCAKKPLLTPIVDWDHYMSTTLLVRSGIDPGTAEKVMNEVRLCKIQDREDAINEAVLAHLDGRDVIAVVRKFKHGEENNRKRCKLEASLVSASFDAGERIDSPVERLEVNERIRQRIDSRQPIGRPRKMYGFAIIDKTYRIAAATYRKAAQMQASRVAVA